ncbi:DUF1653 domain-containing protein [Wenzhouxiangella marina]|uniref:Uncharacterized protein n=1 Tax=Wenzhouxiangella marina TaxID=1579979 RepID=A0A0K0Y0A5_9GAMM|nr:DUF1653 domain-containing protein [Wenzhouxiangella marina]AKS43378.1 hypothetical protein WM2015_3026 [Wenzhouxiangella marina]MBB6088506.1 hypothetical protein [Wenzhouxiangella marina]
MTELDPFPMFSEQVEIQGEWRPRFEKIGG